MLVSSVSLDIIVNSGLIPHSLTVLLFALLCFDSGAGVTGSRNPLETAKEIHLRTMDFLLDLQGKKN
jgi:hypothetical protein